MADVEEPRGTTLTTPVCSADHVFPCVCSHICVPMCVFPRVCSHVCVPTCELDLRFTDFLHHYLALHGGVG